MYLINENKLSKNNVFRNRIKFDFYKICYPSWHQHNFEKYYLKQTQGNMI